MTGVDRATQALRELVLAGRFPPDEKVPEEVVARELDVSRTLARLAMGALEREGLLHREPRRGSRVRGFSIDDMTGAIEVRGELEAMAARFVAERGLADDEEERDEEEERRDDRHRPRRGFVRQVHRERRRGGGAVRDEERGGASGDVRGLRGEGIQGVPASGKPRETFGTGRLE